MWNTRERSWIGRTNIFSGSWKLWVHSKTMWKSKDIVDNHRTLFESRIFEGVTEQLTMLGKSSNLFMVLWHGRSCEEMRGKILWIREKTTQQIYKVATPRMDDHQFQKEMGSVWESFTVCSQLVLKCLYLARVCQWTNLPVQSRNGEHETHAWRVWSLTFITHVSTGDIVM